MPEQRLARTRRHYAWSERDRIAVDNHFLRHLREAAYEWAIESFDQEQARSRHAAIWFGRATVTLIDEVLKLRMQLGEKM